MHILPVVRAEHRSGCLECGAELVYLPAAKSCTCAGCGGAFESAVSCAHGHFFCDTCHSGSALDVVQKICSETTDRDPLAITVAVMNHPKIKMHGPEHHFLVPAALVAAWCNTRGEPERRASLVAEARKRSDPVVGGFCGYQGACGAAIGTGIFVSLVTGATPRSRTPWAQSNRMTSVSLGLLADQGGPRCCKRDSWLSVLAAAKYARRELGVAMPVKGTHCEFTDLNPDCQLDECPFHRAPPRAADQSSASP